MKFFAVLVAVISVAVAVPIHTTWTLHELSDAIQNPSTDPALLPYLTQALDQIMTSLFAGEQTESIMVPLPASLTPTVVPEVAVTPVAEAVAPSASPLVQIVLNINQAQASAAVSPAGVVAPVAPVAPVTVIDTNPIEPVSVVDLAPVVPVTVVDLAPVTPVTVVDIVPVEPVNVVEVPVDPVNVVEIAPVEAIAISPVVPIAPVVNPVDVIAVTAPELNPVDMLHPVPAVAPATAIADGILV